MTKIQDLRQLAHTIKTETKVGGNTADRVGSAFEGVADALEGTEQIAEMDKAVQEVQQQVYASKAQIQSLVNALPVVQQTGDSTTSVMSQKAVSDKLAKKADTEQVNNSLYNLEKKIGDRVIVNGNVTNLPDEEDVTSVNNKLKFKDREVNAVNFQPKGYIILRKNLVETDGIVKNILTQSMINKPNTIYEIRYSFDLNGETITFPKNIILKFNGGCLFNGKIRGNVLTQNDLTIDNFKDPKSNDDTEALQLFIDACYNVNVTRGININKTIYLRSSTNLIGTSRRIAFIIFDTKIDDFVIKVGTEDSPYVIEKLDSAYWSNCNIEHLRLAYKDALHDVSNDYNDFAPKCLLFNNNGIINDVSFSNFKINLQRDEYIDNLIIRNVFFSIGNKRKLNYDPAIDFNVILLGPCGDNIIIENAGYANIKCKNINNLAITNGIQLGLNIDNCYVNIQNLHNENTDMFPIVTMRTRISIYNSFFMVRAEDALTINNSNAKIENCKFKNHPYYKEYFYLSPNCIKTIYSTIKLYDNVLGFGSPIKVNDDYVDDCTIINDHVINNNQKLFKDLFTEIKIQPLSNYFNNSRLDTPITGNFDGSSVTYNMYIYLNFERRLLIDTKTVTLNPTENQVVEIIVQDFSNAHLDVVLIRTFKGKKQYYNLKKIIGRNTYIDNNYIYYADNTDNIIDVESPNILIKKDRLNYFQNTNYTISVDKLQNKNTDLIHNNLKLGDTILLYNNDHFLGKMTKYEYIMYNDSFAKLTDLNVTLDSSNLHFVCNLDDATKINKGEDIKYYGGQFKDMSGIDINKRFGSINNVPTNVRIGQIYYLDNNKPIFYNGTIWLDSNGNPANVQTEGSTDNRPSNVKLGFIYKDTTLNKLIIWDGTKWVNLDGTELS